MSEDNSAAPKAEEGIEDGSVFAQVIDNLLQDRKKLKKIANLSKTLSDETRLNIFFTLLKTPSGMPVTDIAKSLNIESQQATSYHLRLLETAGLLECQRKGKFKICSVPTAIGDLLASRKKGYASSSGESADISVVELLDLLNEVVTRSDSNPSIG